MAYYYCYETLASIPTSTAKACADQTNSGVNQLLANDLEDCKKFYGNVKDTSNKVRATDEEDPEEETKLITFSDYSSTTDLFASWYIQEYILPVHQEEEVPFNPLDPAQVTLS